MPPRAAITSIGRYLPPRVLDNKYFEQFVATNDEWIRTRTGITTRHHAEKGVGSSELATPAARECLERRGLGPDEIDLIIVATVTPDMMFPATACLLQANLGATRAWAFDLSAACSGFVYALTVGAQFVESGAHKRVLVVGVDVMSSILDFQDRTTCILFGDGAGAVLLEPAEDGTGLLAFTHEVDGTGGAYLHMPAGGSLRPPSHETVDQKLHFIRQEGQAVFKYAVRKMAEASVLAVEKAGLQNKDIDLFIPHQANIRIIDAAQTRLGLPDSKVIKNIAKYGNTTAATIPLGIYTALEEKRLKKGDNLLMTAVGAGFTVGSAVLRWSTLTL
ncbi:MAG: ketoacyl-ACP synthase III [Vicinamibacteria bacterium]|nr:ketoacyl-ACP synthase III [Vicinamibacteria bacterium]